MDQLLLSRCLGNLHHLRLLREILLWLLLLLASLLEGCRPLLLGHQLTLLLHAGHRGCRLLLLQQLLLMLLKQLILDELLLLKLLHQLVLGKDGGLLLLLLNCYCCRRHCKDSR